MKTRVMQDEPGVPPRPTRRPERTLAAWMRRHRLVSFFLLAFVLAWWAWPLRAAGISYEPGFVPAAPLLAALIVLGVAEGWAGLRDLGARLLRWRVGWRWYAVAVGLPLTVIAGTAWINVTIFDANGPALSALSWSSFAMLFALRLVNPMDGPIGEEPGWRGYAIPRMQTHRSPLTTAVILGVLVAAWHLPIFLMGGGGLIGLPTTFVITIVYVWLFNHTNGSVLLTVLFHVTQGTFTFSNIGFSGADMVRMEWLGAAAWALVAIGVVVLDRAAWRSAPAAAIHRTPDGLDRAIHSAEPVRRTQ
jgi:uncharacterized protein